jgi:UDP-glucose 4-epimerase
VTINRILVLGHSGFIGQSLLRNFAANNPEVEVIGFSAPGIDFEKPKDWDQITARFSKDAAVVFLAAVKRQLGDTLEAYSRNMSMISNLVRAIENNPVGRVVFFSSGAVYGEDVQHGVITEETAVQPTSYYGIYKFTAERLLSKICTPGSLVCLRPPTAYGGGDLPQYGPSGFVYKSIHGEPITLWGDGEEMREFVLVDDVVDLTRRILFSSFYGVLNVCAGKSYSFRDVLREVSALPTTTRFFVRCCLISASPP